MPLFAPRIFFITLAIALAGCGAKSPEERLSAAQQALQRNDLKAAEIELKTVLQDAPGNVQARLLLAKSMQEKGNWADSEKELRKAQEHGASAEQVLPMLIRTLVKMRKFQEAVDLTVPAAGLGSQALASLHAERANAYLALNKPADAAKTIDEGEQALANAGIRGTPSRDLQLAKARLALVTNQRGKSMAILDAVIKQDAKFVEAMYLKAQLLNMDGKPVEALNVYQQIIATNPTEILAHVAIADSKLRNNDLAGAEKALQAAEKVDVDMPLVKHTRAKLLLLKGDLKRANEALQQVLRVAPDHIPSLLLDAVVNYGLGNYELSLKSAEKVLARVPGHLPSAKLVAANELRKGNYKSALITLTPLLQEHPQDAQLLATVGEAHLRAGDYDKAMSYLDRVAKIVPNLPTVKTRQALGHLGLGKSDQAIDYLERATELSDRPGQADIALVMVLLGKREYDRALQAITAFEKKVPSNPVIHNLRAGAYIGKNDWTSARRSLEQALAIKADFLPAAINLARLDIQERKLASARKRIEAILERDKNNEQALLALADLASLQKSEQELVRWLEQAIKAQPQSISARARLAHHYLKKKDKGKALQVAREGVKAQPYNPAAIDLLGQMQLAAGDYTSAVTTYLGLVQQIADSPAVHVRLAEAQFATKNIADARVSLNKALKLDSGHQAANDALIRLELADGKPDAALQVARRMQSNQPKSHIGFDREADIHLANKRYPQAIQAYEQALARGAGAVGLIKLHRALIMAKDRAGADRQLMAWIKQNPNDVAIRAYAATIYTLTGQNKEAITQYEQLQRLAPADPVYLNNLALLYLREKDSRALATAEQALRLAPNNPGIQDTLGWILVEQGQIQRGTELLRTALSKAPKFGSVRYHYAVALAKGGNKAEAKRELERLVASGSKFPELEEARAALKGL